MKIGELLEIGLIANNNTMDKSKKETSAYKQYLLDNKEQVNNSDWKIDKNGNIKKDFIWSE